MSVTGLCQICEAATARYTCGRCGRVVCGDHWNDAGGACTACLQGHQQ
ncbi:zinc finger HIT domain-containing protein [Halorubrum aidingense]|nr:zinc finger HIT domain-containing protein [Halorubrum aidingense]